MKIVAHGKYSITVVSATTRYEYGHFNPYQQRKLRKYLKRGYVGRAWQLLRGYPLWSRIELE